MIFYYYILFYSKWEAFLRQPSETVQIPEQTKNIPFLVKMLQKGRKNGTNSVKQTKIFCKILVKKYELDNFCE